MKKVLAIVLAVIMTFSMTVAGFAAMTEVSDGMIFLGMDDVAYANAGETIDIPVRYCGKPFASDDYPTDGTYVLQFWVDQDVNDATVNGFTLSDEAVALGAELYVNEESEFSSKLVCMDEEALLYCYQGTVLMPASAVATDITLGTLNLSVSAEWVPAYEDENNPDICTNAIAVPFAMMATFINAEEAALVKSGELVVEGAAIEYEFSNVHPVGRDIQPRPYEPTKGEYLTEYLKGIAALLVEAIGIGLNFLKGELETAPWYDPTTPPEGLEFLTKITAGLEEIMGKLLGEII